MGATGSGDSLLSRMVGKQRRAARKACAEMREATEEAGCRLPSLGLDAPSGITGEVLVDMGRAAPDVITRLAEVIRVGAAALAAEAPDGPDSPDSPEGMVTHLWAPRVGDLVVDISAGLVGEFCGEDGDRWRLAPLAGGDEWTADPVTVRFTTPADRARGGPIPYAATCNQPRAG
ncbi:hypothetical protein [Kitasatospora sp. NPDC087315]|uniref:hypothetical protein n=1 Tax=Kitasatospora sp. NPDC087315 TaxID=3364069 RepID=UPI003806CE24